MQYASVGSNNSIFQTNKVSLAQLKELCRQRADMENSNFITDSELTSLINLSYGEYYDLILSNYEDDYTVEYELTISSGETSCPLPSDFMKLRGVDYKVSVDDYIKVSKFQFSDRNKSPFPRRKRYRIIGDKISFLPNKECEGEYRLWYIPVYPKLTADYDTIGGVNGWEDLVVIQTAIYMLQKEESDVTNLMVQKAQIIERISSMSANRDAGGIETVVDTTEYNVGFDYDF